ncbi:hypothetical protein F5878DRAFT_607715 [Lentinula raphanica]|uniref:Secreted protein n=1 Tax=Lentinula raphanica TaxID=153919 RepID=A0AA38UIG6_9AGAR|nr:hypothetical protein F5878DRAFT_607715 [Lentinula raphanica]
MLLVYLCHSVLHLFLPLLLRIATSPRVPLHRTLTGLVTTVILEGFRFAHPSVPTRCRPRRQLPSCPLGRT